MGSKWIRGKPVYCGEWIRVRNMMNRHFPRANGPCELCLRASRSTVWYSLKTHQRRAKMKVKGSWVDMSEDMRLEAQCAMLERARFVIPHASALSLPRPQVCPLPPCA